MAKYITDDLKPFLATYLELEPYFRDKQEYKLTSMRRSDYIKAYSAIYEAFTKLADGLMRTNRFYLYSNDPEGMKHECIMHLMAKVSNFDLERNPFAYFNMVARNFLLFHKERNKRRAMLFAKMAPHQDADAEQRRQDKATAEGAGVPEFLTGRTTIASQADRIIEYNEQLDATVTHLRTLAIHYRDMEEPKKADRCKALVLDTYLMLLEKGDESGIEKKGDLYTVLVSICVTNEFTRRAVIVAARAIRKELQEEWGSLWL